MKRKKANRVPLNPRSVMPVIHDGLIAGPDLGGDPIAVVVVDARERLDVREAVKISRFSAPGDVISAWGRSNGTLVLHLDLLRPVPAQIIIPFPLPQNGTLVDLIFRAEAFYLQPGKPGDKLGSDITIDRLLIQVDSEGLAEVWPALYINSAIDELRKKGLRPLEARKAADAMYEQIGRSQEFRIPSPTSAESAEDVVPPIEPGDHLHEHA